MVTERIVSFEEPGTGDFCKKPATGVCEAEVVELYDQLRIPVLRYLLSGGVPAPDAEEIVQETFLLLFRHLREGKPRTNLSGWVFGTAHNLRLRNRSRWKRELSRFCALPEDAWSGLPDRTTPSPDEHAVEAQRHGRLRNLVSGLSERDQQCLSLRAEGLRYREIAQVLGISLGGVALTLDRAIAKLRRGLER